MARVRPFSAWRYALPADDFTSVTAPPYDVISEPQRDALVTRDAHNVVLLELPDGPDDPTVPSNRYENGAATWREWREQGVLAQDSRPAVYLLEQSFEVSGRPVRRRAFIVEVELQPFDAGVVLPHERTLPKALGDRFELIKATAANFSQVFGLFDDPHCESSAVFERMASGTPIAEAIGDDGVTSRLWACTDPALSAQFSELMEQRQIFIADGHHRYTTALAYRDLRREESPDVADAPYDFIMMALVNMDDPELVVLPTHRVADAPDDFDPESFRRGLSERFLVEEITEGHPGRALDGITEPAYLIQLRGEDRPFRARLRPDIDLEAVMPADHSGAWQHLDVAVLQELILHPLLDIHPDDPQTLERLAFVKDPHDALAATAEHDVAVILRPTRMDQLREVALAGDIMPQKSTYFYPKLLSGLLFRSAE